MGVKATLGRALLKAFYAASALVALLMVVGIAAATLDQSKKTTTSVADKASPAKEAAPASKPVATKPVPVKDARTEEAECKADLRCFAEKHGRDAERACKKQIEELADGYQVEWTNWAIDRIWRQFMWWDEKAGTLRYIGDSVKFQNQYGAWANMTYYCTYDPATKTASRVAAERGKL